MTNLIVILFNILYHIFIVGFNCKGCEREKERERECVCVCVYVCEDSSKLKTEEFLRVTCD